MWCFQTSGYRLKWFPTFLKNWASYLKKLCQTQSISFTFSLTAQGFPEVVRVLWKSKCNRKKPAWAVWYSSWSLNRALPWKVFSVPTTLENPHYEPTMTSFEVHEEKWSFLWGMAVNMRGFMVLLSEITDDSLESDSYHMQIGKPLLSKFMCIS